MRKALLCWLLLCVPCFGQALAVKGDKTVAPYKIVRLQAENPAPNSAILWDVTPEDVADVMEIDGNLFFVGPPGKYRVTCSEITIVGTKPVVRRSRTTVTITGDTPIPPDNPPAPADPLLGKLRAVYHPGPENTERVKRLAAIYYVAAKSNGTCFDANVTGLIQLYNIVATASGKEIPLPILEAERNIIAAELRAKLPTKDEPLTDALRKQVASEFSRVATVLGELAK